MAGPDPQRDPQSRSERLYHGSVRALSLAMVGIGLLLVVLTAIAGGGPLAFGFLLGLAFIVVGAGRLWLGARLRR